MAYDVFISYGHADKLVADAACARLEARGIRCWIAPRDLLAGQSYAQGITEGLRSCRALVLVFSDHANLSRHVANEVERAVHNNLPIIPLRIADVKPEGALEYFIGSVHWLDALTPPLEQHLERLADDVARLIGQRGQTVPDAAPPRRPMPASAAPAPKPRSRSLLIGGVAAIVVAGLLTVFIMNDRNTEATPPVESGTANPPSPLPAPSLTPAPTPDRPPPKSAETSAKSSAQPKDSLASSPPSAQPASASAADFVGCWMFQGALMLRVFADGRATGAPGGGDWTKSGPGQYVITWPKSTDTVVVSTDGKTFSGSNNYAGFGVSGQRLSGATSGLVGTWRIGNFIAVFTDSGDVRNDQVTGTWTRLSSDTYRIEWNYRFVDQLTIGPDGKTASGKNQLGIPLSGVRTSCGGAPSARSVGSSAASR